MKLTKQQLKQIIKEEFEVIKEVGGYRVDTAAAKEALIAAIQSANRDLGEDETTKIFNELQSSPDSEDIYDPYPSDSELDDLRFGEEGKEW